MRQLCGGCSRHQLWWGVREGRRTGQREKTKGRQPRSHVGASGGPSGSPGARWPCGPSCCRRKGWASEPPHSRGAGCSLPRAQGLTWAQRGCLGGTPRHPLHWDLLRLRLKSALEAAW